MNRGVDARIARDHEIRRATAGLGAREVARGNKLRAEARVGQAQVVDTQLRQKGLRHAGKFLDGQADLLIVVFFLDVTRGGADQHGIPQRLGEMDAEAHAFRMGQRIDEAAHQV